MRILGMDKEFGATYQARRIENNEVIYGIGVIKVDEEKSYLIQMFETNDFTDSAPAMAYYVAVKTDSIISFNNYEQDKNNKVLTLNK